MPEEKFNLDKILSIKSDETIYSVIGKMEILLEFFNSNKNYSSLKPFLETYLLITKSVAEKYSLKKSIFQNLSQLQDLDIFFAKLYFQPLLKYLKNKEKDKPWKTYFEYSEQENGIPIIQLMLGINAHINTDLFNSLKKVNYKSEADFFLVNNLLLESIPQVMRLLLVKHDPVGFGGMIFKNFIEKEFHLIIETWRSNAWANYKLKNNENLITENTEKMGKEIINTITNIYNLHKPFGILHLNQISVNKIS